MLNWQDSLLKIEGLPEETGLNLRAGEIVDVATESVESLKEQLDNLYRPRGFTVNMCVYAIS